MARLSEEELAAFVEASCARSGVPGHVDDSAVIGRVAVLLLGESTSRASTNVPPVNTPKGVKGEHGDGDESLGWAV